MTEKEDVDAFCFDFTRTLDENTSIRSMFQVLEEIKNGDILSAMFGNPMESIIPCLFVLIFTNEDISGYYQYLLKDRWQAYAIIKNELLAITKFEPHNQNLGLDLRRVLGPIRRGVTMNLIHVRKLLFHLVINGTLTMNFIVMTLTKIKKINTKIKLPFKVNVDLEFCNLELTRTRG